MKVGLVGKRARAFVDGLRSVAGVEVAGLCDQDPTVEARYRDFDEMLAGERLDAVVVATPMQLHAPQAIAALDRGLDVLSEVTAAITIDECQALVRVVRESGKTYMMAENYCFSKPAMMVREMTRRGLFGETYYAEGAYIHDCRALLYDAAGQPTWRRELQAGRRGATYPTHSLGPVLDWLDDRVETVTCLGSGRRVDPALQSDTTVSMLCQTARGALVDVRQDIQSPRPHDMSHYVLQGTRGAYTSGRHAGEPNLVWIEGRSPARQRWQSLEEYEADFLPDEWREHGEAAILSGHGGADFFVARAFALAIRDGTPPPIDVYRALDFTLPGLVSEQSIAAGGVPVAVPDPREW